MRDAATLQAKLFYQASASGTPPPLVSSRQAFAPAPTPRALLPTETAIATVYVLTCRRHCVLRIAT